MKRFPFLLSMICLMALWRPPAGWSKLDKPAGGRNPLGPLVHWYDAGARRYARISLDEVAVFPKGPQAIRRQPAQRLAGLKPRPFAGQDGGIAWLLRIPEALSPEAIAESLSAWRLRLGVDRASPVLYRTTEPDPGGRMALTGQIIVQYPAEYSRRRIASLERRYGLTRVRSYGFGRNMYLYEAGDPLESLERANRLVESGRVVLALPNFLRSRVTRAIPDDPLFSDQWHLDNEGQGGGVPGEDVHITPVWDRYPGTHDEVVAIVDNGVEIAHEDLVQNVLSGYSWDYVEGDPDPTGGGHGTSCAGVAAGRGFNGRGITGAAPGAALVGYRLLGANTDANEADAETKNNQTVDIYSNSWGPYDGGIMLDGPGPLTREALRHGALHGRGGLGNIYLWAAGNGGESDNANYDGYANSRYVIAVGASTNRGDRAWYSERGANILVNAPSSGGSLGITTTDSNGKYLSSFGGTSSASPLVAGIIALMLQANPMLTWRDVRHILAATADQNDPSDPDWTVNGAGYPVNHQYGFGRVNAQAAVSEALSWKTSGPETSIQYVSSPDLPIPDADAEGVRDAIFVDQDLKVEFVEVRFSASDHPYWGDLEVTLESPSGTQSVLAEAHYSGGLYRYDRWRFGSVRHLGEDSRGSWTLRVRDLQSRDSGTLQSWRLRLYGVWEGGIEPREGTVGTVFTISGSGFGDARGKVKIAGRRMKVLAWGDSAIVCRVRAKNLTPGEWDVTVLPAGEPAPRRIDMYKGFIVRAPELSPENPASGVAGQWVGLAGWFFGSKKGKIWLEWSGEGGRVKKRRCRVPGAGWSMDPSDGSSSATFRVPDLPAGTYVLRLKNKAGEALQPFTIESSG